MSLTVLFDLDDTLLVNNMDSFIPAYFQALAKHLSRRVDGNVLIHNLLHATRMMIANTRPDRTLEQVFDSYFYPGIGIPRAEIQEEIDTFYAEVFPQLRPHTSPQEGAVELVEFALQRGFQIAVATNPLFPRPAVLERLAWAGLPVDRYPLEVISTYENFHFTKPNPAYFAEVMGQLGWPPGPAVMVGNDWEQDILPAQAAGISAYWLSESRVSGDGKENLTDTGGFAEIGACLDRLSLEQQEPEYATRDSILAILRSTPAVLSTLTASLTPAEWSAHPFSGEWGLVEIACHLRDVAAEVDIPRIEKLIHHRNPFIPAEETDEWAEKRNYRLQSGPAALQEFIQHRMHLLQTLEGLSGEEWELHGRHAIFGPTTLRELACFSAAHDRAHVQQSFQILKTFAGP